MAPWVVSTTNCGVTADGVVYRFDDPWFQCSFNMIFTLEFTVICTSLKWIWYFSLNTCFTMLGWVIYRIIIVSFYFLLKIEDRRLDGFVIAGGTAGCHNDSLRCHWWWQASRFFLRVAQNKVFKCFIYVLNPNNLYIYFKLLHVTYLFIIYYPFTYLFFCIFTAVCLILYNWFITCFYCTLIMCMLLSATSTHFKWELMLHCFTLSDFK